MGCGRVDLDPKAVANAETKGLTVHRGGIEYFDGKQELFDVITINHVIEHVYDPSRFLRPVMRCSNLASTLAGDAQY